MKISSGELLSKMIESDYWEVLKAIKEYAEYELKNKYIDLSNLEPYSDEMRMLRIYLALNNEYL